MIIAIHHRKGSFSDRWIKYCEENLINYKIVNAFDNDIIEKVKECDIFMWHHHHGNFKDVLVAKNILYALEHAGVKVFPDFNTAWHFDNKVAQKYLFEAMDIPFVPSYVFYDKKEALLWIENTTFPKVFKLKGGAGAANVKLVKSKSQAIKLVNKAFGKGFPQFDRWQHLKDRYEKYKRGKDSLVGVVKAIVRLFVNIEFSRLQNNDKGYIYFQDFIPNNNYDLRIIVVNGKAFALKRMVRENDFRASGSGSLIYERKAIDERCIKTAFDTNKQIKAQSIAFDFIFDQHNSPLVVEISYGYAISAYDKCEGYWDEDLNFIEKQFIPQNWMIDNIVESLKTKN